MRIEQGHICPQCRRHAYIYFKAGSRGLADAVRYIHCNHCGLDIEASRTEPPAETKEPGAP